MIVAEDQRQRKRSSNVLDDLCLASGSTSVLRFRGVAIDVEEGQENFGQENGIAEEQGTLNAANFPVPNLPVDVLLICTGHR